MDDTIVLIKTGSQYRQSLIALLQSEQLPVTDLPLNLDNFLLAIDAGRVVGAIGLEKYDNYGLLRSMVVDKDYRNKSIASVLINELENMATELGIDNIYLLTETAALYFERKGYKPVERTTAPLLIRASSEFSSVCPASATLMQKAIKHQ